MASRTEPHHCRVLASRWAGVYATDIDSGRHFGKHWHATYGFGLLDAGAQRSASGRGMVEAFPGDVITTNPGEVHDGRPLGGPSRRWRMVYLDPEVMASMGASVDSVNTDVALARPVLADRQLARAIALLLRRLESWNAARVRQPNGTLACEEALTRCCELLLARHATGPAPRDAIPVAVAQVRERLAADLLAPPSLAQLAALAGASKYQVLRAFSKAYGVTPHAWLLQQRAERARVLVARGVPLARAAADCGFADQSHMTRIFTRQFGFPPGACRPARLQ